MKQYKAWELLPEEKVYLKSEVDAEIEKLKAIRKVHIEAITSMGAGLHQDSEEIRKLKRALYKACANWALSTLAWLDCIDQGEPRKWSEMQQKCLKKVEEFK